MGFLSGLCRLQKVHVPNGWRWRLPPRKLHPTPNEADVEGTSKQTSREGERDNNSVSNIKASPLLQFEFSRQPSPQLISQYCAIFHQEAIAAELESPFHANGMTITPLHLEMFEGCSARQQAYGCFSGRCVLQDNMSPDELKTCMTFLIRKKSSRTRPHS